MKLFEKPFHPAVSFLDLKFRNFGSKAPPSNELRGGQPRLKPLFHRFIGPIQAVQLLLFPAFGEFPRDQQNMWGVATAVELRGCDGIYGNSASSNSQINYKWDRELKQLTILKREINKLNGPCSIAVKS